MSEATVGGDEESFPRVLLFLWVGVHCFAFGTVLRRCGIGEGEHIRPPLVAPPTRLTWLSSSGECRLQLLFVFGVYH